MTALKSLGLRATLFATAQAAILIGVAAPPAQAQPRYPVQAGETPGPGFQFPRPQYPTRLAEAQDTPAPPAQVPPPAPTPSVVEAEPAPRAAPAGTVSEAQLAPPASASTPGGAASVPSTTPPAAAPSVTAEPSVSAPPVVPTPAPAQRPVPQPAPAAPAAAPSGPYLQSGVGEGPPRFTIGAPLPPPTIAQLAATPSAQPAAPSPTYARPAYTPPQPYARPSYTPPTAPAPAYTPPQSYQRPSYTRPSYTPPTPPTSAYARPSYTPPAQPAQGYTPPSYPRPSYTPPSPPAQGYTPPGGYARPSYVPPPSQGYAPGYARPYGAQPYAPAPSVAGAPRPYSSLYASRSTRSAGIRSTPSDPGIAPQALSLAPDVDPAPRSSSELAALGRGRFLWPLRGPLLTGFGDLGGGRRSDGLNIAATVGEPVRAAAAGEVVYAGELVPGQGKLVLLKHAGGWVTAYAHLSRIAVRMRQAVGQGEAIGEAGQTGAVDRPQLHFEIRYASSPEVKAAPVDPTTLLPNG